MSACERHCAGWHDGRARRNGGDHRGCLLLYGDLLGVFGPALLSSLTKGGHAPRSGVEASARRSGTLLRAVLSGISRRSEKIR